MHPLWLFKGHYEDLREAVGRGTREFAYRHLAADLRGLLVDAAPITDAANRMFRLGILFQVLSGVGSPDFAMRPGGVALNELLLAGPNGCRIEFISRDALLALPAVRLADGACYSLRDVVLAGANIAGGVHGMSRGAAGARLQPLAAALFGPGLNYGGELLVAVARHVLAAYKHLFTLAENASLGIAQPRPEYQPLLQHDAKRRLDGTAIEFAGHEFFEDGLPGGLSTPFAWVASLALRLPDGSESELNSAFSERCILDIGAVDRPGPRFSVVQRGRSILARFIAAEGEVIATSPLRLMDRRFYAVAAGVAEKENGGQVRAFVRVHGNARHCEVFGPLGVGMGAPIPSRLTVGASLDRSEARAGRGALMQLRDTVLMHWASEQDIDATLEGFWRHCLSRRWVVSSVPEVRVPLLYNQARNETAD